MRTRISNPCRAYIQGKFGPLVAGEDIDVPLWLALELRESGKCRFVSPKWLEEGMRTPAQWQLTIDYLTKVRKQERSKEPVPEEEKQLLPYHWREIAHRVLTE